MKEPYKKITISARISPALDIQLNELKTHLGITKTRVVEQAINLLHSQIKPPMTGR